MSRRVLTKDGVVDGAPRVSGDEPELLVAAGYWSSCSPRERG